MKLAILPVAIVLSSSLDALDYNEPADWFYATRETPSAKTLAAFKQAWRGDANDPLR